MARRVASDLHGSIPEQLFEIGRQLRQLDPEKLQEYLQIIVEGCVDGARVTYTSLRDMEPVFADNLELVPFLAEGERFISGKEMKERAKEVGALDQRDSAWLLDHKQELPPEWRSFYLVLPGPVGRGGDGLRFDLSSGWRRDRRRLSLDDGIVYPWEIYVRFVCRK